MTAPQIPISAYVGTNAMRKVADSHQQERSDQRRLAADAITVMAKDGGPDRPADKTDEIGPERCKGCGERILVGEVKLAEYQTGSRAVEEKVIPFDGCADCRGNDRLAQMRAVLGCRQRAVGRCRWPSEGLLVVSSPSGTALSGRFPGKRQMQPEYLSSSPGQFDVLPDIGLKSGRCADWSGIDYSGGSTRDRI